MEDLDPTECAGSMAPTIAVDNMFDTSPFPEGVDVDVDDGDADGSNDNDASLNSTSKISATDEDGDDDDLAEGVIGNGESKNSEIKRVDSNTVAEWRSSS